MKKQFLIVAGIVSLFTACKEKPPIIKLTETAVTIADTTYVGDVPAPQDRNVLIEEFTGASCTNCPAAHEELEQREKDNPGRLNVLALYIKGPIQTTPPHDAQYDFRHQDSKVISDAIFGGVNQLPTAGVDRRPVAGVVKLDRGAWGAAIQSALAVPDSINLTVYSGYNPDTQEDTIICTMSYPYAITFGHNLHVALVQDNVVDVQEYPTNDPVHPGSDEEYDFTNIIRSMATTIPLGDPILTSMPAKEPGRVIVKVYILDTKKINDRAFVAEKMPPFVPADSRIVAWITNSSNQQVMQSAQVKFIK